jgi:hypothetical protein
VIDLYHPSLNEPNKKQYARDVIRLLKSKGEILWARYKGHREIIFWGSIPMDAILHVFPLSDLDVFVQNDSNVGDLFRLDLFNPDDAVITIAQGLTRLNLRLNRAAASALGKVAKLFGLEKPKVAPTHVKRVRF